MHRYTSQESSNRVFLRRWILASSHSWNPVKEPSGKKWTMSGENTFIGYIRDCRYECSFVPLV